VLACDCLADICCRDIGLMRTHACAHMQGNERILRHSVSNKMQESACMDPHITVLFSVKSGDHVCAISSILHQMVQRGLTRPFKSELSIKNYDTI